MKGSIDKSNQISINKFKKTKTQMNHSALPVPDYRRLTGFSSEDYALKRNVQITCNVNHVMKPKNAILL